MKKNMIYISAGYGLVQIFLIALKDYLIYVINQHLAVVQMQIDGITKYSTYISVINGAFYVLSSILIASCIILLFIVRRMTNEQIQ